MRQQGKAKLSRYLKNLELEAKVVYKIDPFEDKATKAARIARAKEDVGFMVATYFPRFATSPSADFQLKAAKATLKNPTEKKFLQWGRGLAKSVWANIFLPFWLWINGQAHYMVIVTTSKDRAEELLEDLRAVFEANTMIIHDFGEQKSLGQWEKGFFVTKGGFVAKAMGVGQSVRGLRVGSQRPDYIVVDDLETKETIANPARQKKNAKWIEADLIPTMDGDKRRFIYANNRFAPEMIQTMLQERHPNWRVDEVPAYCPVTFKPTWGEKYADDYFKIIEQEIGTLTAQAEYNNCPHIEGEIFTEDMIQWGKLPRLNHFKIVVGHWDVAFAGTATADYNAVKVWGAYKPKDLPGAFWYIDGFVKRSKIVDAIVWMCQFQNDLPKTVIVHWRFEAQFWNDEIERTINAVQTQFNCCLNIVKMPLPRTKKYDRMLTMHPYYQNGRIYYNEQKKSHSDTQVGIAQLLGLAPNYKGHDDSPDADERCITELSKYIYEGSTNQSLPLTAKYERKQRF